jgi:Na+-driven multidrug efflux pump
MPAIAVAQSYFQGVILHSRRTRSITESVGMFLVVVALLLIGGVLWGAVAGLYFALGAFTTGEFLRVVWLWSRSRQARRHLRERDSAAGGATLP